MKNHFGLKHLNHLNFLFLQSPHPGIGPQSQLTDLEFDEYVEGLKATKSKDENTRTHYYYQWVPIVLALQAAVYYLPIWIWKQYEKGYFQMILCGLHNISLDGGEKPKVSM